MAWMILAAAVFSINFGLIRFLSYKYSVFEIVFVRSFFGFIFFIPFLVRANWAELKPKRPILLTMRAILQVFALTAMYFGLVTIPLADATALGLLEPIFAGLFAVLFFKEKSSFGRWVVISLGVIGSLIIIRPGFVEVSAGAAFIILSAVLWAIFILMGKILTQTDSTLVVVAYPTALVVPVALIPAIFFWRTPTLVDCFYFATAGILSSIANFSITKAYQIGEVTVVSSMAFSRLIFSAVIGYLAFSEVPVIWVWFGGIIIVAAATYLAHVESKAAL